MGGRPVGDCDASQGRCQQTGPGESATQPPVALGLDLPSLELLILDVTGAPDGVGSNPGLATARRAAVVACLECWDYSAAHGERWAETAPVAVKLHARRAARAGVGLLALLRCYARGRDLAWKATMLRLARLPAAEGFAYAQTIWAASESLLACVQSAVEAAYRDEIELEQQSSEQRQANLVYRLLWGDRSVDLREIAHDFTGWHLAVVADGGEEAQRALSALADRVGCRLYCLPEQDGITSGWLLLPRDIRTAELERYLLSMQYPGVTMGVGRSAEGVDGFCHTHQLAWEALRVAQRRGQQVALHAEVELDALLLRDQASARSLIANYITPLDSVLLQTLRVCHAQAWNESAAARALGVNRSTVRRRTERIQHLVGSPLDGCLFSVELALRAVDLNIARAEPSLMSSQQPVAN